MMRRWAAVLAAMLALGASQSVLPADKAIVILISADGFRADYLDRLKPPHLLQLAARGVRADGLIPQFPADTFPNHYTIATGLAIPHHGIVSNDMTSPDIPGVVFAMSNRDAVGDARWWGGEPIWNTAERQGRKAAPMFWPGSEAPIGGRRPSYWMPFNDRMPHADRIRQILDWLALPEASRPSFITLYFSEIDTAGHSDGPDSPQVAEAVSRVDASIGALVDGVARAGLADRVHYVVVSDHGMAPLSTDRVIYVDDYINVDTVDIIHWSPTLAINPKEGTVDAVYQALAGKHPHLSVYRNRDIPARLGLAGHPRVPAIYALADDGWVVTSHKAAQRWSEPNRRPPAGAHGYDPDLTVMRALFVAAGPRIREGVRVPAFKNIHIYDFMCAVLGLTPAKNDGDPAVTRDMLR